MCITYTVTMWCYICDNHLKVNVLNSPLDWRCCSSSGTFSSPKRDKDATGKKKNKENYFMKKVSCLFPGESLVKQSVFRLGALSPNFLTTAPEPSLSSLRMYVLGANSFSNELILLHHRACPPCVWLVQVRPKLDNCLFFSMVAAS